MKTIRLKRVFSVGLVSPLLFVAACKPFSPEFNPILGQVDTTYSGNHDDTNGMNNTPTWGDTAMVPPGTRGALDPNSGPVSAGNGESGAGGVEGMTAPYMTPWRPTDPNGGSGAGGGGTSTPTTGVFHASALAPGEPAHGSEEGHH